MAPFLFVAACGSNGSVKNLTSYLFDPVVDGFSFVNYNNSNDPLNLSAVEVHRMFGDAVCESGSGESCLLTPTASQWLERQSKAMEAGHCEGMAVLSLLFEHGMDSPQNYDEQATVVADLTLEDNELLQREIGYWFALQGVYPVSESETRTTPVEVVDALERSFYGETSEKYTLGIYKPGYKEGHAITPFDVVDGDYGTEILVYDNNFPGEERSVLVDEEANTWYYSTAANPDDDPTAYEGDASTKTLGLTPVSARTGHLECPFCGDYRSGAVGDRTISVTGDAALLIVDEIGNALGHAEDGSLINEIPGARFSTQRSANLSTDQSEPTYVLPGGFEIEVLIEDAGYGSGEVSDVSVVGKGYFLGIESISLAPGQVDAAYIGADTASIAYVTDAFETPDIVLATETEGADWIVVVRSRGDSGGQEIDAALDYAEGGVLDLYFDGNDEESEFDLFISRFDGEEIVDFGSEMIRVPNGAELSLRFADFDEDGTDLSLEIDADGDGTADETKSLADTGGMPRPMGTTPMSPTPSEPSADQGSGGCATSGPGRAKMWAAAILIVLPLILLRRRFPWQRHGQ